MIVREIIANPEEIIDKFDFFNDYKDTMAYLESKNEFAIALKLAKAEYYWRLQIATIQEARPCCASPDVKK